MRTRTHRTPVETLKRRFHPRQILRGSIAAFAAVVSVPFAKADNTWDGGGASPFNWSDATNWGLNTLPAYGTLTFSGATGTTNTVDVNFSMNQLLWTGTSAWTLNNSGGAVISLFDNGLVQSKIENQSSGLVTINAPINFAAVAGNAWAEINAVGGNLTFGAGGTINVSGSAVGELRFFGSGKTVTINSTITAGARKLVIGPATADNNTVILNAANSYSGNTEINVGTVQAGNNTALGTSTVFVGNGGATFANLSGSLLLNASGLTVANNIVTNKADTGTGLGTGTRTIGGNFTSGTSTFSGNIALNGGAVLSSAAGGTVAFTGVISNGADTGNVSRNLTISAANTGTISLSETNTFTGNVNVDSGILRITNSAALGTGTKVISLTNGTVGNPSLQLDGTGGPITLASSISLNTSSGVPNGAIRNLAGDNVIAGNITLTSGGGDTHVYSNGGSLKLTGTITANISSRGLVLRGTSANANAVTGVINNSNTPNVKKEDAGTWILSGANTYAGGTTISAGTLAISSSTGIGTAGGSLAGFGTGAVTINSAGTAWIHGSTSSFGTIANAWTLAGGTLHVEDGATTFSGAVSATANSIVQERWGDLITFSGIISGTGGLTFQRSATGTTEFPTFLLSGVNTTTGTITAGANATVRLGNAAGLGATSAGTTVASGGVLDLNGLAVGAEPVTLNGTGISSGGALINGSATAASLSGTIALATASSIGGNGTGALTLSGVISGANTLTKVGTGITILTGANTYTGATTVSAGLLRLGNATAIPGGIGAAGGTANLSLNGGLIGLGTGDLSRGLGTGATQIQLANVAGFSAHGAARLVNFGGSNAAVTWGSGGFAPTTLVLGHTTSDSTVTISNPINLGATTRTIQIDNGSNAVDGALSGVISGTGGLTVNGAGLLQLSAVNTYSGATTVSGGGSLRISNSSGLGSSPSVTLNTGTVAAGQGTTLDLAGGITIGAGKTVTLNTNTTGDLRASLLNSGGNNVWAGNVVLAGTGFAQITASAGSLTINGNITSTGAGATGTMAVRGAGTVTINGNINLGTERNFSHTDGGTVIVNSTGNTWKMTQISDGQIQIGINDALATGVDLQLGQASTTNGRFEMNGFNQTVAALRTTPGSGGTAHVIRNSNPSTPSTLTFTTAAATTDVLKNTLVQGSFTTPGTLGALHLVKNGTGRFEVEAGTTEANSWTVNSGTLAFTGTTSRALPGAVFGSAGTTIEKAGASSLVASGTWNHAGATLVSGGSLTLSNGSLGTIAVSDGATLGAGLNSGSITATALTFGTVGATTFAPILGGPSGPAVINSSSLTTAGTTVSVNPAGASFAVGVYPLIDYSTIGGNGFAGFALGATGTYPHITATLVDNTIDGRVDLNVTAVDSLIWTGATNATWDTNLTSNFALASSPTTAATFFPSDAVLFGDTADIPAPATAITNRAITITGNPTVGNLTFNNSLGNDYTLTGSFAGPGGIIKNGTGTATIASATSFTGPISVTNGTLILSGTSTTHGNVNVTGGTLKIGAGGATALINPNAVVTISSGGTFDAAGIAPGAKITDMQVSGAGVGGAGAIINSGGGITNNNYAAKLTLLGDTAWGGTGRYDMPTGTLFLGGNLTLTKVGTNESWWGPNAGSTLGPVVINGGLFGVQSTIAMSALDGPITVNAAGTLGMFGGLPLGRQVNLNDGAISGRGGGTSSLAGTVNLQAADVAGLPVNQIGANGSNAIAITGSIVGPGGFEKFDTGTVQVQSSTHTYAGNTLVSAGTLNFNATGALPTTTNLIVNGGTFDPSNLTHSFASISGTGGAIGQGAVGTGVVASNQSTATTYGGAINRIILRMAGTGSLTLNGTGVSTSPTFEANAGTLTLAGTADNSAGIGVANSGGTLVLAKTATDLSAHAVGTGLTINSGGTAVLGGSAASLTGTGVNAAPAGAPANYVDQVYNAVTVSLNAGGVLDLGGVSEAVNGIAGAGGTITNTVAATTSKLYVGHQNGASSFGGSIQDGAGTVALEKIGSGVLTLTGSNSYTGSTSITAGTLAVPSGASLTNSAITISGGTFQIGGSTGPSAVTHNGGTITGDGTIGGTITTASGGIITIGSVTNGASTAILTAGGLSLSGGAIINADFTGTALDRLALGAGTLNLSGTNTVNIALGGAGWVTGTYPLISYGTLGSGGPSNFALATPTGHSIVTFTDAGGAINLDVVAGVVKWNGNVSSVWDHDGALNWQSVDSKFLNGDNVVFDDTAAGPNFNPTVTTANVTPASVTFNNTLNDYTLGGGTLGIGGAGQFFKQGTGTVTLTNANTFTGATNVQAGTLIANYNSGTAVIPIAAASPINISAGATFKAVANDANLTLANTLSGSGTVVIDPHYTAATAVRDVVISGSNAGFTGTLRLSPTTGVATGLGTFRTNTQLTPSAAGGATIDVDNGGQAWLNNGTFANNFIISGMGYAESAGGTPVAASGLTQYTGAQKGGIGAIRLDNGAVLSGTITLDGPAKIMAYGGTGTISGSIASTSPTDTLIVGGGGAGTTLVLLGTNNTGSNPLTKLFINSGGTAGTNVVAIGANGTSGTLGTDAITLNGDAAQAVLRFDRADGYTLLPGNVISAVGATLGNTFVDFDTQGTGFNSNGVSIALGTPAAGGVFRVGLNRPNTVTNISGALTGGNLNIGAGAASTGATLNLNSGANVNVANIAVALAATNATVNIAPGATVNATGLFNLGEQATWSGTVNQSGGDVTVGAHMRIGHWPSNTSAYNLSAGTLTVANANSVSDPSGVAEVNGGIYLGVDGTGLLTQSGGTLTTDFLVLDNRGDTAAGIDTFTLNSGTLVLRSQWGIAQRNVSTAVNLAGGTIQNGGTNLQVRLDTAPNISGAVTLDTVSAGNSFNWLRNADGAGSLALAGGGTLKFTTTTTQSVSVPISGTGAIEKLGTGTTTLSAANTYNGATTVTAGRLNLTGSTVNSALTLAAGATLGGEGTVGSLTLNGGTIVIDPNSAGALTANGSLTATGINTVDFTALPAGLGPYTIVNYGTTFTGTTANFALANPANFRTPTFSDTGSGVGPAAIVLNFATADLTWTGAGGNTWNIATTTNWNDITPAPSAFFTGDRVTFDDTAPGAATSVTLAGSIQPGSIAVNSSSAGNNYTLTASAGNIIAGSTNLLKTGTSTLTLAGAVANTFTGGTTIAQGAINIQHGGSFGTGVITLNDATTGANPTALYLDTNRSSVSNQVVISNNGTGTATLGSRASVTGSGDNNQFLNIVLGRDVTFDSNAADRTDYENISGTGNVTVTGTGRTIFITPNSWSGDLIVATTGAASLQIGTVSAPMNAIPDTANVTVNSGALLNLSVSGNESINGLNGSGTVGINAANSTLTLGANNGSGNFSGVLQGSGGNTLSIAKAGTGTQILSGTNTYGGTTAVTGGILQVGAGGASGQLGTGAVTLSTGTTLSYNRTGAVSQAGALNSATAGAGTLTVEGGAALTLSAAGNFSGAVNVTDGSLILGATNPFSGGASSPNLTLGPGTTLTNTNGSNHAHFNNVTLNGATWTTGAGISSFDGENYQLNGNVTVTGTAASTITRDSGRGNLVSGVSLSGTRTFDVSDVTSSIATDLTVNTELENPSGGSGGLIKTGAGTMALTTSNSFTGSTTVTNGTLIAGAAGALGSTSNLIVNTGGTLLLDGSGNRIGDTVPVTLAGGTFNANGFSETLGTLTLTQNSVIDMGLGASILSFADSSGINWVDGLNNPVTLSIWNWSGTPFDGGGSDQLRFANNGLTASQLSRINFYSDAGMNKLSITAQFSANGFVGGFGEVTPVPEPSAVATVMGLLGLIGWRERRKAQASRAASRRASR